MTDQEHKIILEKMRAILRGQKRLAERYVELEHVLAQAQWERSRGD